LDKRHGQAVMHNRLALAEVLKRRGGDRNRSSIRWLNDETIHDAVSAMHPVTGDHPIYGPIGWWATGKVTNMRGLFAENREFNGNLSGWDVSNVTVMSYMFSEATVFTGKGLEKWTTSSLEITKNMFEGATNFNADLGGWDVSGVEDMSSMFSQAEVFTGKGLEKWTTSSLEITEDMFERATNFNADLGGWDVSNVTNMAGMFIKATAFTGKGLDNWKVTNLTSTEAMFRDASNFNADLGGWDVSNVKVMSYMFENAKAFTGKGLDEWKVTNKLKEAHCMFENATNFNANLGGWDVSELTLAHGMFSGAKAFKGDGLDKWKLPKLEDAYDMFMNAETFDADLRAWNVSSVQDMSNMFANAKAFTGRGLDQWNTRSLRHKDDIFEGADNLDPNVRIKFQTPANAGS
jgi:surface protein